MKNILEILSENSVSLTDDQKKAIESAVKENYKTVADYDKQSKKLELADQKAKDTEKAFDEFKKDFEGVDVKELQGKVTTLTETVDNTKKEYESKIKKMELESSLRSLSDEFGCIDFDLAKTQFDFEKLLGSKNQKDDAKAMFESLKESKPHLFEKKEEPRNTKKKDFLPPKGEGGEDKPTSLKDALKSHYSHEE